MKKRYYLQKCTKIIIIGLFAMKAINQHYLRVLHVSYFIPCSKKADFALPWTKASKNTFPTRFISEASTVTPQFFCFSDMSWSLSNCSKSWKKSERGKILSANILKFLRSTFYYFKDYRSSYFWLFCQIKNMFRTE